MKNVTNAVISGIFAASASALGKLCGLPMLQEFYVVRVLLFVMMILCNAAVWRFFVRGLQESGSVRATAISSSTNYICSAIIGFAVFGEVTSLLWWSGMILIILGLVLIVTDQEEDDAKEKSN
nr:unnamed protein product [Callosobruchus chinensis]